MEKQYENIIIQTLNKKRSFDILIVDDDKETSEMFKDILEMRGHTVTTIYEGVKCISTCKSKTYDIIFMDYHIEDIDGVQVTDFIRDIYKTNSIIFAYTGDSTYNAIEEFKKTGMVGALVKPVDPELINNIMRTIEERKCIDRIIFNKLAKQSKGSLIMF